MTGLSRIGALRKLYLRDLVKLRNEIELYRVESSIWKTGGEITNSGGNLCLHLIGNLNAYIGAELGNSGYVRNRDLEFSSREVARKDLLAMTDETSAVVDATLGKLTDEALNGIYPLEVLGERVQTGYYLAHLTTHFAYHLGQINYHRRIFDTVVP